MPKESASEKRSVIPPARYNYTHLQRSGSTRLAPVACWIATHPEEFAALSPAERRLQTFITSVEGDRIRASIKGKGTKVHLPESSK
ncbi:hypothetical protein KIPB_003662 [Kipferlia bialata]|uniref:Uncharacterized protein n=1 Tax=Kipferlia bialata TaxID=797122 RepID=A0A9K3CUE5_9EUKA|nr:hypothetical protein KIPB_003662 [Kipferlia bialata]|eukprot:g3662.t1